MVEGKGEEGIEYSIPYLMQKCPGCRKGLGITNRGFHHDEDRILDLCLIVKMKLVKLGIYK